MTGRERRQTRCHQCLEGCVSRHGLIAAAATQASASTIGLPPSRSVAITGFGRK